MRYPYQSQAKIYRAIKGAVRNAADAHPRWHIDERFEISIAKRAVGTLSAQWPEVLAARLVPSEKADDNSGSYQPDARYSGPNGRRSLRDTMGARGSSKIQRRSPLKILWRRLAMQMRDIKASGNEERVRAYIEILRMVAELQRSNL